MYSVSVDFTALSSAKLRILLPVLPSTDAVPKILASDKIQGSHSSKKLKKLADNKLNTVSNIFNRTAPISVNDGVYGYKSIVLKKITEEGLKDVIKNGSKSKETATITYKVKQSRRFISIQGENNHIIGIAILSICFNVQCLFPFSTKTSP